MVTTSLKDYLDEHRVPYQVISHEPAFTAQCIADLTHTPGRELAKAIMVKLDDNLIMAVLPAMYRVDLGALKRATKAKSAVIAFEEEFYNRFPDCETGAMPPFGHLYGVTVFADESLMRDEHITFNAGTHREVIRMTWEDYVKMADPKIIRLAARTGVEAA